MPRIVNIMCPNSLLIYFMFCMVGNSDMLHHSWWFKSTYLCRASLSSNPFKLKLDHNIVSSFNTASINNLIFKCLPQTAAQLQTTVSPPMPPSLALWGHSSSMYHCLTSESSLFPPFSIMRTLSGTTFLPFFSASPPGTPPKRRTAHRVYSRHKSHLVGIGLQSPRNETAQNFEKCLVAVWHGTTCMQYIALCVQATDHLPICVTIRVCIQCVHNWKIIYCSGQTFLSHCPNFNVEKQ